MVALVEHLVSLIRLVKGAYGDAYSRCVTVVRINPDECELMGVVGSISREEAKEIRDALLALGYKRAKVVRYRKDGKRTEHWITPTITQPKIL